MPTDDGPVRSPVWFVRVSALLLTQSSQNITLATLALLLPLIRSDIPMTYTEAGLLSVVTTLTYALGQIPAGYLGDRLGQRRVMLVGLIGLNALSLLIAIAPSYVWLAALFTAIGAFRALAFPPGLALMTAEFPSSRRATAMSLFMTGGFSSNLIVSLAAPALIAPLGWRGVFAAFGALSLVTVAVYWAVSRDAPTAHRRARGPSMKVSALLSEPLVWLASIVQFTRLAVTMALRFWLPSYLIADKGFTLEGAALAVGVGSAVSVVATLAGGQVSDRLGRPLVVIASSLAALTVGLAALTVADGFVVILVVITVLYIFVQAYSGSLFEVPLKRLGTTHAGTINGFGNFWANLGGLTLSFALGVTKDATGSFNAGWLALSMLCVVSIVATVAMRSRLHTPGVARVPGGATR
jgi:nitrate/nitrite transporter NarK